MSLLALLCVLAFGQEPALPDLPAPPPPPLPTLEEPPPALPALPEVKTLQAVPVREPAAQEQPPVLQRTPAAQKPAPQDKRVLSTGLAAPGELPRFSFSLRAGADRSAESFTPAATLGHLGAEASVRPLRSIPALVLFAAAEWRTSRQTYLTGVGEGGRAGVAELDEQRTDASLCAGYDLGALLFSSGRLVAMPTLGARYLAVRNGSLFPADLFGLELGARLRFFLSQGLVLQAAFAQAFDALKHQSTPSSLGRPFADTSLRAGVSLPFAGGHSLDLDYQGDVLALRYDRRVSHGASVGLRSEF